MRRFPVRTQPRDDGRTFPPERIGYHALTESRNEGATGNLHARSPPQGVLLWTDPFLIDVENAFSVRCAPGIFTGDGFAGRQAAWRMPG
jgi:hypothetical protein